MSDDGKVNYAWRPATRGDIGSLARFCDRPSRGEIWLYGILTTISHTKPTTYYCSHGADGSREVEGFAACEIQYNADEEP